MSYVHADHRYASVMVDLETSPQRPGRIAAAWARLAGCLKPAAARWPQGIVRLPRHGWRTIERPDGLVIRGLSGVVWVTQSGDPQDHLLAEGQTMRINGNGHLIVHALDEAAELRFSSASEERTGGAAV